MSRSRHDIGLGADWPLALFTGLAGAGAALLLAPFASFAAGHGLAAAAPLAWQGLALVGAGLAVSLSHLGRPLRAPLAARHLGQSRLSAEVVLALATAGAGAAVLAWPSSPAAALVSAASASLFLLSLGLVYALPGQHAWGGPSVAIPLSMALPLAVLGFATVDTELAGPWRVTVAALLGADLALFAWRARRLGPVPFGHTPAHPGLFARRRVLLAARVALVTFAPLWLTLSGHPFAAAATLAAGMLVDRVGFYALAVRHTTEGEIEAIENTITT